MRGGICGEGSLIGQRILDTTVRPFREAGGIGVEVEVVKTEARMTKRWADRRRTKASALVVLSRGSKGRGSASEGRRVPCSRPATRAGLILSYL